MYVKASMKKRFLSFGDKEDSDESDRENDMDEDEDKSTLRTKIGAALTVLFFDLNLPLLHVIGMHEKLGFINLGFKLLRGE